MMVNPEDLLIFKMREKKVNAGIEKPQAEEPAEASSNKPATRPQEAIAMVVDEVETKRVADTGIYVHTKKAEKQGNVVVVTGRELADAKGRYCEWHPWRPAYAVCDYCHRAFCYEDTMEFGKGYYCLEDIDKVSEAYTEKMYTKYNSISFLSAGLFMLVFVVFTYFASGQLLYILDYGLTVGLQEFITNINYSYGSALIGFALTAFGLITAVLIFVQSRSGFATGLIVGLAGTAFFSYQFLGSGTTYLALMSAMTFCALALLAYSKVSYIAPDQTQYGIGPQITTTAGRDISAQTF